MDYEKRGSSSRRITPVGEYRDRERRNTYTADFRTPRNTTKRRRKRREGLQFWQCILIDVAAVAAFLLIFAYFHHVNPIFRKIDEPITLPQASAQATQDPTPTPDASQVGDDTQVTDPQTSQETVTQHKFEDKFSAQTVHTDTQYINQNVNVTVSSTTENGVTYHVADIYVRDVKYLQTDFATENGFGYSKSHTALIQDAAKRVNAFVAINGDQYGARDNGVVVRNGVQYRDKLFQDVCVLKNDGTMVTYGENEFSMALVAEGAWQAWSFGPELLDESGQPLGEYNTTVGRANPRSAIGMIEPLHYILITVDGRGESAGLSMDDLAHLMQNLGCTVAYNLDGGGTAAMAVNGELYSVPSKTRSVTDIIYVAMED